MPNLIRMLIAGSESQNKQLWAWGENTVGQLGNNTSGSFSQSPVQAIGLYTDVSHGYGFHVVATRSDGTLWGWGGNNYGQVGDSTTVNKSSPVQIGSATDWSGASMSAAYYSTLVVKSDGTLWAWGKNDSGELGIGSTTSISVPGQVGSLTDWASVSSGYHSSFAVKTDGTLWSWGDNTAGQLGDGTTTARSSPAQVGALTDWSSVSSIYNSVLAIKTDGSLWAWGDNTYGQLGDGTTVSKSSPVQIGALTNWSQVASGLWLAAQGSSFALKSDGTIWGWGYNGAKNLGNGGTTNESSPIQIGSDSDWSLITDQGALKTNGAAYVWGSAHLGRLAGTTGTSPSQVGTRTGWEAMQGTISYVVLRTE